MLWVEKAGAARVVLALERAENLPVSPELERDFAPGPLRSEESGARALLLAPPPIQEPRFAPALWLANSFVQGQLMERTQRSEERSAKSAELFS